MRNSSKFVRIVALILCCVLLVFLSVEATHMHTPGTDAAHCQLCMAAHLALGALPMVATALLLCVVAMMLQGRRTATFQMALSAHRIRPPPVPVRSVTAMHLL